LATGLIDLAACSVASSACLRNLIESSSDMLFAELPYSVYFAYPLLDLIGQLVKATGSFRVAYLIGQTAALDNVVLNPD
jgi:hypothetical protein